MNLKTFFATVAGLIVAFATIQLMQMLAMKSFPVEAKIVIKNARDFKNFIENIPSTALIIIALGNGLGVLLGAIAINKLSDHAIVGFMVVAVVILIDVSTQVLSLPHPVWFKAFDIACVLIAGVAGWKALKWK
jgi:NAD/NADP transhydrogenase alpha subunit